LVLLAPPLTLAASFLSLVVDTLSFLLERWVFLVIASSFPLEWIGGRDLGAISRRAKHPQGRSGHFARQSLPKPRKTPRRRTMQSVCRPLRGCLINPAFEHQLST
jgi:hypothetical protein